MEFLIIFRNQKTGEVDWTICKTLDQALAEMKDYKVHYPDDEIMLAIRIV